MEIITSIFAGLITMGVGRIWWLTDRKEKENNRHIEKIYLEMDQERREANIKFDALQQQISNNNRTIAVALEQIRLNGERDNQRMTYIEKLLDKVLATVK